MELKIGDEVFYFSPEMERVVLSKVINVDSNNKKVNSVYNIILKENDNYFINNIVVKMK